MTLVKNEHIYYLEYILCFSIHEHGMSPHLFAYS